MKLIVNKKQVDIERAINVYELLELLNVNSNHCAVAIGNKVVKKSQWSEIQLSDEEEITIINATCGG